MSSIWAKLFRRPSKSSLHAREHEGSPSNFPTEDREKNDGQKGSTIQDLLMLAEGLDFIVTAQGSDSPTVTPIVKEIARKTRYLAAQEGKSLTALVGNMREQEAAAERESRERMGAHYEPRLKHIEYKLNKLNAAIEEIFRFLERMEPLTSKTVRRAEPRVQGERAELIVDSHRYNVTNWSKHGILFSVPEGDWSKDDSFNFQFILKNRNNPLTFRARAKPVRVANDTVAVRFSYDDPGAEQKVDKFISCLSAAN